MCTSTSGPRLFARPCRSETPCPRCKGANCAFATVRTRSTSRITSSTTGWRCSTASGSTSALVLAAAHARARCDRCRRTRTSWKASGRTGSRSWPRRPAIASCRWPWAGPGQGFAGVSIGADELDDLSALRPTLEQLRGSGFLFVHPVAGLAARCRTRLVAAGRRLHGPDATRLPRVAGERTGRVVRRHHRVRDSCRRRADPARAARLSRGRRAHPFSIPTSSSTRRPTGAGHSSSASRRSASSNIVHGSDAPVIDPEPTLRAIRDFGESVEKLIMCANPDRLLS